MPIPSFNSEMRQALLECCCLDWSKISPAIFGAMFQSVMNADLRRNLGAHYTSEKNIRKVIEPLFLEELKEEFENKKNNKQALRDFHNKISKLKFLDPACGCGNFLIIAYKELRLLELKVIKQLFHDNASNSLEFGADFYSKIDVDQFYGVEIEEFPAKIAEVALWLTDHQMNMEFSKEFGYYYARLPLKKSPTIIHGNALRLNWEEIIPKNELNYIFGNPPFVGKQQQNDTQKEDMKIVFTDEGQYKDLDFVTAWYLKAARYIKDTKIKVALVSTNSITQGEQVGLLWNILYNQYKVNIHFAHKTFKWNNEARNQANVYVVIIGFAHYEADKKYLYEYDSPTSEPHELEIKNMYISPYLTRGKFQLISNRKNPVCEVPEIRFGNMPNPTKGFIYTKKEMLEILGEEPAAKDLFKRFLGNKDFLYNKEKYCLWLVDVPPNQIANLKEIKKIIEGIREVRLKSTNPDTIEKADTPTLFWWISQPKTEYLLIPSHTSENRKYIPFGFIKPEIIVGNSCMLIEGANFYHFGVLSSIMHMTWVNYVCGRIKGDYRYSNEIVYNNYPWAKNPDEKHIKKVEEKAQALLEIRKKYPDSSLADLYAPITMPPDLVKAHNELDKAVDKCYRSEPFKNELERIEFLFDLYEKYTEE